MIPKHKKFSKYSESRYTCKVQSDAHSLPQRVWNGPPQTKSQSYILKQGDANTGKESRLRNEPKELTQGLFFKCEPWLRSDAKKYFCLLMKGQASQSVKDLNKSELWYHHQIQNLQMLQESRWWQDQGPLRPTWDSHLRIDDPLQRGETACNPYWHLYLYLYVHLFLERTWSSICLKTWSLLCFVGLVVTT